MTSSGILISLDSEVLVAQCLLSMSKESLHHEQAYTQCECPSLVSDEEHHNQDVPIDQKIENNIHISSNNTKTITNSSSTECKLHSYSYDNMIPANQLPKSNEWENEKHVSTECQITQVWDSTKGSNDNRELKLLESIVSHERKELALELFHENNYRITGILDRLIQHSHKLDWSEESKALFSTSINRNDKNFSSIARRLNKDSGDCQEYYYSTFKRTREYLRMKRALRRSIRTRSSDENSLTTFEGPEKSRGH